MADAAALRRALDYPYEAPEGSYLFLDGHALPIEPDPAGDPMQARVVASNGVSLRDYLSALGRDHDVAARRTPVIGIGSNRAPEQLARKYGADAKTAIPCIGAWLKGYDVVFAARLSSYGAIPATVAASEDAVVDVRIAWLTDVQLERMHETEGVGIAYDYGNLDADVDLHGGGRIADCGIYVARAGPLLVDGTPRALSAVSAASRVLAEWHEQEALSWLRDCLAPGKQLDRFVTEHLDDNRVRLARSAFLSEGADRMPLPRFRMGALT